MSFTLPNEFLKIDDTTGVALPVVMGILNVTPDSFSDGGLYCSVEAAVAHAKQMIEQGARIIDVGGESTRPGAQAVPESVQIERVVPVIDAIRVAGPNVSISIDTCIARVAEAALNVGANIVNDISALRDDPAMADVVAESDAYVILMHRRGTPLTMQQGGGPVYDDVVSKVAQFLLERAQFAESKGIDHTKIMLDPGIGFGKTVEDNLLLMRHLDKIVELDWPVLVGVSRKSCLGKLAAVDGPTITKEAKHLGHQSDPKKRLAGSLACAMWAASQGVAVVRVHDVRETVEALNVWRAIAVASKTPE